MSLFPRYSSYSSPPWDNNFRSLFRVMDDLASNYETNPTSTSIRAFSPKFDVVEAEEAYNLHGELPGLDQKDISIEFTDPHTLVIKGRTETRYETPEQQEGGENSRITDASHQPTVEDESAGNTSGVTTKDNKDTTMVSSDSNKKGVVKAGQEKTKYWVSERSVGEFYRSFNFPSRVDQDGVKASLKQGVLSIVVPKLAASKGSRKINIESVE